MSADNNKPMSLSLSLSTHSSGNSSPALLSINSSMESLEIIDFSGDDLCDVAEMLSRVRLTDDDDYDDNDVDRKDENEPQTQQQQQQQQDEDLLRSTTSWVNLNADQTLSPGRITPSSPAEYLHLALLTDALRDSNESSRNTSNSNSLRVSLVSSPKSPPNSPTAGRKQRGTAIGGGAAAMPEPMSHSERTVYVNYWDEEEGKQKVYETMESSLFGDEELNESKESNVATLIGGEAPKAAEKDQQHAMARRFVVPVVVHAEPTAAVAAEAAAVKLVPAQPKDSPETLAAKTANIMAVQEQVVAVKAPAATLDATIDAAELAVEQAGQESGFCVITKEEAIVAVEEQPIVEVAAKPVVQAPLTAAASIDAAKQTTKVFSAAKSDYGFGAKYNLPVKARCPFYVLPEERCEEVLAAQSLPRFRISRRSGYSLRRVRIGDRSLFSGDAWCRFIVDNFTSFAAVGLGVGGILCSLFVAKRMILLTAGNF